MNLAGVVILYHPDNRLYERIHSYLTRLGRLYIMDNTEGGCQMPEEFHQNSRIQLIQDGENRGISARLNQAADLAINAGYQWLLTMDQDSFFDAPVLEAYLQCVEAAPKKDEVAMFGLEYEKKPEAFSKCQAAEINYLITSGSLVNLKIYQQIGGFDEALFIDEVDLEYCYRAKSQNFRIIKFENIFLNHQLGKVEYRRSFKSFEKTPRTLHSPVRVYYMVRNYLYVNRKFPGLFEEDNRLRKKALLNRIKNNFLYGKNKGLLLKFLIKAVMDYKVGKMGKLSIKK